MTDFYFDPLNYDMGIDGGDIAFTDSTNEVEQRLTSRLQFITGEWFLDIQAGLPYPDIIFEAGTDLNDIYGLLRQKIKDTDGVEILNSLTITPNIDERSIRVDFRVNNETTETTVTLP